MKLLLKREQWSKRPFQTHISSAGSCRSWAEEGVYFPNHAKADLLSPPTPAGSRMETWKNRESHPQHATPPQNQLPSLQLNPQGRAARQPVHRQNWRKSKRNPGRVMVPGLVPLKVRFDGMCLRTPYELGGFWGRDMHEGRKCTGRQNRNHGFWSQMGTWLHLWEYQFLQVQLEFGLDKKSLLQLPNP